MAKSREMTFSPPYRQKKGRSMLRPYKGWLFGIIGSFGDCITSNIKGKDLFIGKYRKVFGLKK